MIDTGHIGDQFNISLINHELYQIGAIIEIWSIPLKILTIEPHSMYDDVVVMYVERMSASMRVFPFLDKDSRIV